MSQIRLFLVSFLSTVSLSVGLALPVEAFGAVGRRGIIIINNGGDFRAQEFVQTGLEVLDLLKSRDAEAFYLTRLEQAITETRIIVMRAPLIHDGVLKDAINTPNGPYGPIIKVNAESWDRMKETVSAWPFVLHEYLGIAGIPDFDYRTSLGLLSHVPRITPQMRRAIFVLVRESYATPLDSEITELLCGARVNAAGNDDVKCEFRTELTREPQFLDTADAETIWELIRKMLPMKCVDGGCEVRL